MINTRGRGQTRTFGGAYQNPSEGIVDYTAFGRGLQAGLKPGLDYLQKREEEIKAYKYKTFGDVEVLSTENKIGTLGITEDSAISLENSASDYLINVRKKYIIGQNPRNPNKKLQQEAINEFNDVNKALAGYQLLVKTRLDAEEVTDTRQEVIIGTNAKGEGITLGQLLSLDFQEKIGNNFKFEKRSVDGKIVSGVNANGYFIRTDNINENNIGKYAPLVSNLNNYVNDSYKATRQSVSSGIKPSSTSTTVTEIVGGKEVKTTKKIDTVTPDSYIVINEAADKVGIDFATSNSATFKATYLDAIGGKNQVNSENSFLKGYGKTFKYGDQEYAIERFYEENTENGTIGNVPDAVKQEFIKQYASNEYKLRYSQAYKPNQYGHAVETTPIEDRTVTTKEAGDEQSLAARAKEIAANLKNPGGPIKDLSSEGIKNFINLILPSTKGGRAFSEIDGESVFVESAKNMVDPATQELYTEGRIAELWRTKMLQNPAENKLIFIDSKGEIRGLDIGTEESTGSVVADVLGIKGNDKLTFIQNFTTKPVNTTYK